MYPFLDWGIPIIEWLQNLGAWLTPLMQAFTFVGDEQFYLLILPLFVWWFDVGLGLRIGIGLLLSAGINGSVKLIFGMPRPYWVDPGVKALSEGTTFGFPSGHSQNALVVWGRLAAWFKRRGIVIGLSILIFLISLSRMVLGVHYPTDVLGGWLIGGLLLWALVRLDQPLRNWLGRQSLGGQIATVTLTSLAILAIGSIAYLSTLNRAVPASWVETAASKAPEADPIDPQTPDDFITAAGTLLGMGIGGALLINWGQFRTNVGWPKRVGRYILGVVGLLALYLGLSAIFPKEGILVAALFRYLRYALLGIWVTYLAPRLFSLLRLS
jgi:membrane-associated phospholipid phosphatase